MICISPHPVFFCYTSPHVQSCAVINGPGGHGKDEFVTACTDFAATYNITVQNVSSIDPCRVAAAVFGYDPTQKSERDRNLLIAFKAAWLEWNPMGPTQYILDSIQSDVHDTLTCVHIRETDQIALLKATAQIIRPELHVETIHVLRPDFPIPDTEADRNTLGPRDKPYPYDRFLNNDGNVDDLRAQAKGYIEHLVQVYGVEGALSYDRARRR